MAQSPTQQDWDALRAAERRLLDRCGVDVADHDITIHGEAIHYLEAGDPNLPPLVLVHGRGACAAVYYPILPLLAPHRHLYAIDMPGWGLSTRAPFTGTTPDAAVHWWRDAVLGLIDVLGLSRYDLLGHSLGGMIAITAALERPDQVEHLILEDNGGFPGTVPFLARLYFAAEPERLARLVPRRVFDALSRSSVPTAGLSPELMAASQDFLYRLTTFPGTHESGARTFNLILDLRGSHFTVASRLGELRPLTRAIWGQRDGIIPLTIAKASIQRIPRGDLVVIPDVGHSPHLEAPQTFARLVLEFLARGDEIPLVPGQ